MNAKKLAKSQILKDAIIDIVDNDNTLYEKQREAFVKMSGKELFEISDGYFRLPTAFGKTVMFSLMARAFLVKSTNESKIVILVPRLTLVEQTMKKLQEFADIRGSVYTGKEKDTSADIIVSTYRSANRLFEELDAKKQDVGLLIADEAHHALGEQIAETIQKVAIDTPVVGFTATPTFSEEHALGDLLSNELYTLSIEDCIKNGLLCPVKNILYRPSLDFDILKAPIKRGCDTDFDYKKLGRMIKIQTLIDEIAQLYVHSGDGDRKFNQMRAIVNCPSREIADKQAEKLNELAGRDIAVSVHSEQKDFEQRVKDFSNKKYQIVCQVNTLTEGLDDKSVELCINYPSYSPVKIEQSGGRVLRIYDKKPQKFAYVLDTVFRTNHNETLEDSLRRAFVAGQVLYRDVAGEFVVRPDEKVARSNQSSVKTKAVDKTKEEFEIITDEDLLSRLSPCYKKWEQDNSWLAFGYVQPVDELHDMGPKYLAKRLFNPKTLKRVSAPEVLAKMEWMQKSMPYAIQLKRTANNRRCFFLKDVFYDKFVKNSGFKEFMPQTNKDIDAKKASELYVINPQQAKIRIIKMAKQLNATYKVDGKTGNAVLCFEKKYLKKFAKGLNSRVKNTKAFYDDKTDIDIAGLRELYVIPVAQAKSRLLQMATELNTRYKVDKDTKKLILCCARKNIDKFGIGLTPRQAESEYIDVPTLKRKYVNGTLVNIYEALRRIYHNELLAPEFNHENTDGETVRVEAKSFNNVIAELRNAIKLDGKTELYSYGPTRPNYKIHKDFIPAFCKVTGFEMKEITTKEPQKILVDRIKSGNVSKQNVSDEPNHTVNTKQKNKRAGNIWKDEKTFMEVYMNTSVKPDEFHEKLNEFAQKYPTALRLAGDYKTFLFNLAYLSEFCEFTDWLPAPIPLKTNEYKSAAELQADYIGGKVEDIADALKNFSDYDEYWFNRIVVLVNTDTDLPELCLDEKYVNQFIKISGLSQKNKADAIRKGTKMVATLDKLRSAKKNIKASAPREK